MQRSTDRILTTHVGSLPRPPELLALLEARERGELIDEEAFARRLSVAVREVGHELGHSPVDVKDQREAVARARALVEDTDLKAHLEKAAMVCAGRVEQVRPAELAGAPARPTRISEHDPDWQEAIIEV